MAKHSDSTNVIRLPTAAARKVQQPCNKSGREALMQLRETQRGTKFDYVFPSIREAEARLRELDAMPDSAAAHIVRNMVRHLGSEDCRRVLGIIRCGLKHDDPLAKEVESLLQSLTGTTVGDQEDFKTAILRLQWADQGSAQI